MDLSMVITFSTCSSPSKKQGINLPAIITLDRLSFSSPPKQFRNCFSEQGYVGGTMEQTYTVGITVCKSMNLSGTKL